MTIHYPYPQHANMEMEEDIERVARWLGSIVKPAYFNAFYHKPSVSTCFTRVPLSLRPLSAQRLAHAHTFALEGVSALLSAHVRASSRCVAHRRDMVLMSRIPLLPFPPGTQQGHH